MGVSKVNKLKDLIHELCPNGVEYKKLADCCVLEKGNTPIQKAIPGEYPLVVTTEERKSCNTYQFDKPTVCIPLVSSRGHGVASLNRLYYQEGKFALGNILCGVTPINSDELSAKFLFYYLNHKKDTLIVPLMRGGANVSLTVDSLKRVKVPVPPISVQCEIVRIFDKFEALGNELAAELIARKQQYEHYRDKLLSFDAGSVNQFELNDVIHSLNTGLNPRQFFRLNTEDATNYYVTIREIRGGRIVFTDKTDRINDDALALCNNRSNLEIGDVLFSGTGTIGETAVIMDDPQNWNIKEGVYAIKPNQERILPKFLRYLLTATYIKTAYMKKVAGGTVKSIPMGEMRKLQIPVPTISEQERIVAAIDRFDALCNDLSSSLPAEIEARQKQYEYYRDKLLTFEECKENVG